MSAIVNGDEWQVGPLRLADYWIGDDHRVVIGVPPRAMANFTPPVGFEAAPISDAFLSDTTHFRGPFELLPDELLCEPPLVVGG